MRARNYDNLRRIAAMHGTMENKRIADELDVDPSAVCRMLDRIRKYPERIAALEAELEKLRLIYGDYLEAKEERKKHTKHGYSPSRNYFRKGIRIIRDETFVRALSDERRGDAR